MAKAAAVPWDAIPDLTPIEVTAIGVHVRDLLIPKRDVADYLRGIAEDERALAFIRAVEVGVCCLERARAGTDTEFVKRQVESLLVQVARVPDVVEKRLAERIGTGEGQVLAPVQSLIEGVSHATADRIKEVRELLSQEIDPSRETSTLGAGLKIIRQLLDPLREDSIQSAIGVAVNRVTAEDGALAKAVRAVVTDSVKPLADEVDKLGREVRGREAAAEVVRRTTEKGTPYEEEIVTRLQKWTRMVGAEIHHLGPDNRPGDILVVLPAQLGEEAAFRIVIEARDRESQPLGRKQVTDALNRAMAERNANAAIYLSRSMDGLAKEIGDWADGSCGQGPYVATTVDNLISALRFLVVQRRLAVAQASKREVDVVGVKAQLARIRTALGCIKNINTKVGKGREVLSDIESEAEMLRSEIRGALTSIEEALRVIG